MQLTQIIKEQLIGQSNPLPRVFERPDIQMSDIAKAKSANLKAYVIKDDTKLEEVTLEKSCKNKWGRLFFLTDAEFEHAQKIAGRCDELMQNYLSQIEKIKMMLSSAIVHNIIDKKK